MIRAISAWEAETYFRAADLQWGEQKLKLPDGPLYAENCGLLLIFHGSHWPGIFCVHATARSEALGFAAALAEETLAWFVAMHPGARVMAWVPRSKPLARRLALNCGFRRLAEIAAGGETLDIMEYGE